MRSLHDRAHRGAVCRSAAGRVVCHALPSNRAGEVDMNRRAALATPLLLLSGAAALANGPAAIADEGVAAPSMLAAEAMVDAVPTAPAAPVKAVIDRSKLKTLADPILAYSFPYPVETMSGQPLKMTLAHEPEKYSSAAPLTADARQRIVSSLIDFKNFVTVSMSVGPAAGPLKGVEPSSWAPGDVAMTVLVDRSTSRTTNGQRFALNDVESAALEMRGEQPFWVYEHLSQGSPTMVEYQRETYRHALAVSTVRPGNDGTPYIYTLNLSCREQMWDDLRPLFEEAVNEFKLLPTTNQYVPPDQNPWLFF